MVSYLPASRTMALRRTAALPRRLLRRPHEADFAAFRYYQPSGPHKILDVGANRGQAIESFRLVMDEPHITSFEANPHLAEYLSDRFRGVDVHAVALGASKATMRLYIPHYGNAAWDTRSSLSPEVAAAALRSSEFWWFDRSRLKVEERTVPVRTLDSFGVRADIIKIDVEGAEAAVVAGGVKTISQWQPVMLGEGDMAEAGKLVAELGYEPHRFEARKHRFVRGASGRLNTFLLHPAHAERFAGLEIVDA